MLTLAQFTVGDMGYPGDGAVSYNNAGMSGKQVRVLREGINQYTQKGTNFIIGTGTSTVFFVPSLYLGERIIIQIR